MTGEAEPIASTAAAGAGGYQAVQTVEGARRRGLLKVGKSLTSRFVQYESSSHAMWLCIFLVICYLILGVVCYTFIFERGWTIVDSLYFSVVTFTTVGYGDLTPSTSGGRIFTIFFVLIGIAIVGVGLGILGEKVVEAEDAALLSLKDEAQRRIMSMFSSSSSDDNEVAERALPKVKTVGDDIKEFFVVETPIFVIIFLLAIIIGWYEGWTYLESLYYCIITTTTVGYGDISPSTQGMRIYALFFLPLSVVVVCNLLGRIAGFYMERQARKGEKKFMEQELTLKDLEVMDVDSDGTVSMLEFISFMLVAMQKVNKEDIDELKTLFKSLDVDGSGALEKKDLILMAQKRQGLSGGVIA